jgi:hypothetical protein
MTRHKVVELASSAEEIHKKTVHKISKPNPDADLDYMEEIARTALLDLQNQKIQQVPTTRQFRTSALPFCPILEFIKDPQFEEYSKSHYTTTGTAIHETKQAWLSISKVSRDIMYGSWLCTGCKDVRLNQFRPKKACGCTHKVSTTEFHRGWPKHWTYVEVEYNYNGLTGHIDLILVPKPDFAFTVDFKTTELSKKKLRWSWKEDKVSSPNYVAQIRTYSTILDLEHKLPIRGWMLVNTERGSPIKKASDFHMQVGSWGRKQSLKWQKQLDLSVKNNRILTKLEAAVEDGNREESNKQLKRIIVNRPCHSKEDYTAYMKYKFYTGQCAHIDVCCKGSHKAVHTRIMDELSKKE